MPGLAVRLFGKRRSLGGLAPCVVLRSRLGVAEAVKRGSFPKYHGGWGRSKRLRTDYRPCRIGSERLRLALRAEKAFVIFHLE